MAQREYQQVVLRALNASAQNEFQDRINEIRPSFSGTSQDEEGLLHSSDEPSRAPQNSARIERRGAQFWRLAFDKLCAVLGLLLLSPVLALIALAIKFDDAGPVLYSHSRLGQSLRKFRFLKFRTMRVNSAGDSPVTAPHDIRVTRVGQFLRKYKLDELPQLVNVVKGDMQLVGVRPQLEKHVELFRAEYEELLQSPPGITDLATLVFRNEERFFHEGSIEEQYVKAIMPVKLRIALKYARTRTFRSDLGILFRTVLGLEAPSTAWREAKIDPRARALFKHTS